MTGFFDWINAPDVSYMDEKIIALKERLVGKQAARMFLNRKIEELYRDVRDLERKREVIKAAEDQISDELERLR